MSKPEAEDAGKTEYGIYLDADFCGDSSLTPATRIVLGQIRQYSRKPPYCIASNAKLAQDCGVAGNTVTNAISTLSGRGLINVEQGSGGRRTITAVAVAGTQELCGQASAGDTNPGTATPKDLEVEPKNQETPSQNLGGDLNREFNKNLKRKTKTKFGGVSSSSVTEEDTNPEKNQILDAGRIVSEWSAQASSMMRPRLWHRRLEAGTEDVQLKVPGPAGDSPKELAQLADLAEKTWPRCDPLSGIRQVLLAAAWTSERRDKLQQYAHLASSSCLGARAVLRIGGKDDPLAYARDCVAGFPSPAPVEPGAEEDAMLLQSFSYSATASWRQTCWEPCWREAAGRCRALGAHPAIFMACAQCQYEAKGGETPLPWLANALTLADFKRFLPRYERDRINAWSGGIGRRSRDPAHFTEEYDVCVGCRIAQAAAGGRRKFSSKSCLRCAALDLQLVPALVGQVEGWKGGAAELAALLNDLAADTVKDVPPLRSASCGVESSGCMASFVRCFHGLTEGVQIWDT